VGRSTNYTFITSILEAANLARLEEIVDTTLVISAHLCYDEDSISLPAQGEKFSLASELNLLISLF